MLILGHRGHHLQAPENTLDAFAQALALGADGIETDVRLSADSLLILFHDRLTPDGTSVASLTRNELSKSVGYPVPTLAEACQQWPDVFWNIEIKAPVALAPLLTTLDALGTPSVLITSFWHTTVRECCLAGKYQSGVLLASRPTQLTSIIDAFAGLPLRAVVWDYETLDPDLLSECVDRKLQNFVYGALSLQEHLRLRELPIAGLITDHIELALANAATQSECKPS